MLLKASSFHVYAHQDGDTDTVENCKICDLGIENQDTEYLVPISSQTLELDINTPEYQPSFRLQPFHSSSFISFKLFGRPPPSLG